MDGAPVDVARGPRVLDPPLAGVPDEAHAVQLFTPNKKKAAIVPFAIKLTFKKGRSA